MYCACSNARARGTVCDYGGPILARGTTYFVTYPMQCFPKSGHNNNYWPAYSVGYSQPYCDTMYHTILPLKESQIYRYH